MSIISATIIRYITTINIGFLATSIRILISQIIIYSIINTIVCYITICISIYIIICDIVRDAICSICCNFIIIKIVYRCTFTRYIIGGLFWWTFRAWRCVFNLFLIWSSTWFWLLFGFKLYNHFGIFYP